MTTKILTQNEQVLHSSTYRPLITDEKADKYRSDSQEQFMTRVHEKLGSWVLLRELEDTGLKNIPQYDPYKNETQNEQIFHQLVE